MKKEIGEKLKNLRKSKGLTQEDIAIKAGITRSTVSNYENGRRMPHLKDLQKMGNIFGVGLEYFNIVDKDEVFDLLARAKGVFKNENISPEAKEDLYMEFMKMYLELKGAEQD